MDLRILKYAKKNIDITASENSIECKISENSLYIELSSGKSFQLSDEEIQNQAMDYLEDRIDGISELYKNTF